MLTNKRKKEIINMVLKWLEKNPHLFFNDFSAEAMGICRIVYLVDTTFKEALEFNKFIMSSTKRRWKYSNQIYKEINYGEFIFKPGEIQPRVNYLNKLKKKLV